MQLSFLQIFPIKSLDAVEIREARVMPGGSLQHDREFSLFDTAGKWVRGKREVKLHQIRSKFDLAARTVELKAPGCETKTFHLDAERSGIEKWIGAFFGYAVALRQDLQHGFPDDGELHGPTVLAAASIERVGAWFPGMPVSDVRRRFRANLEVSGAPAFWEDQFYKSADGATRSIRIGDVVLNGGAPCDRCVVVTRDPDTGVGRSGFEKEFMAHRAAEVPAWAQRSAMEHFFMFSLRTTVQPGEAGKVLRIGDPVSAI